MAEMVGDSEVVVEGQVGGVLFIETEVAVDAEACAKQLRELRIYVQILGVAFAAPPEQGDPLSDMEDVLQL